MCEFVVKKRGGEGSTYVCAGAAVCGTVVNEQVEKVKNANR